jgi:hypothetical protein
VRFVAKLLKLMNCLLKKMKMLMLKEMFRELKAVVATVAVAMTAKMMGKKMVAKMTAKLAPLRLMSSAEMLEHLPLMLL